VKKKETRGRPRLAEGEQTMSQHFKLPKSLAQAFKAHANRLGKDRSDIVRRLVSAWILSQNLQVHRKAVSERASKAVAQVSVPLIRKAGKK
jgi:metal-responsive CopG/Arc/MetJ family transcriptional regulator